MLGDRFFCCGRSGGPVFLSRKFGGTDFGGRGDQLSCDSPSASNIMQAGRLVSVYGLVL